MKRALLILGFGLLVTAAVVQLLWSNRTLPGRGKHLDTILPAQITGWSGTAADLGPPEAAEGKVENILRFDDLYFREFRGSLGTISLYVAYWAPGSMPTQLVASH